jgi:hypothetical protein
MVARLSYDSVRSGTPSACTCAARVPSQPSAHV